jgi:hypothetical protein
LRLETAELTLHSEAADRILAAQPEDAAEFAGWQFNSLIRHGRLRDAKASVEHASNLDESERLLLLGLADFLAGTPDAPQALERVLEVHHQYEIYILLLYVALVRDGHQEQAKKVLDEGQAGIDPATAEDRLQDGDFRPWPEMLLGYYLNGAKITEFQKLRDVIGELGGFANSPLAGTGKSRAEFLSELFFYARCCSP